MKRMVTEEEIAEITSKNSKPLYRYIASLTCITGGEGDLQEYSFLFDFISTQDMSDIPQEEFKNALTAFLKIALMTNTQNHYVVMPTFSASTGDCGEAVFQYNSDKDVDLTIRIKGNEYSPLGEDRTLEELVATFNETSFTISETNIITGANQFWEF